MVPMPRGTGGATSQNINHRHQKTAVSTLSRNDRPSSRYTTNMCRYAEQATQPFPANHSFKSPDDSSLAVNGTNVLMPKNPHFFNNGPMPRAIVHYTTDTTA